MYDISGTLNGETGPLLHCSAIYVLLRVLSTMAVRIGTAGEHRRLLTSKVNHEIGSSSGIDVFLTNVRVRASSSNSTV
jgi:hypothetical protein